MNSKEGDIFSDLTEDLLNSGNKLIFKVSGSSMYPTLKLGDKVIIEKRPSGEYFPGEIIAFKREHNWVVHRVVKIIEQDGTKFCLTGGDSNLNCDKPVSENNVCGCVLSYIRNNREYQLKKNSNQIRRLYLIRLLFYFVKHLVFFMKRNVGRISGFYEDIKFITSRSEKIFRWNVFISVVQGMLPLAILILIKILVDLLTKKDIGSEMFFEFNFIYLVIGIIGLILLLQSVLNAWSLIWKEKMNHSVSLYVHELIHNAFTEIDMKHLENAAMQDKIHRAVQEAGFRPQKMLNQSMIFFQGLASWILMAVLLVSLHWLVLLLVFFALIPAFAARQKLSSALYRYTKENSARERALFYFNRVLTALTFSKENRLFSLYPYFKNKYQAQNEILHKEKQKIFTKNLWPEILSQFFTVIMLLSGFFLVIFLSVTGKISMGSVVLFVLLFFRGFTSLKEMFRAISGIIEDRMFFLDFKEFLTISSAKESSKYTATPVSLNQKISLKNVSFSYPGSQRTVLKNLSFELPAGKTLALVGANGSGKSTLIKLLCGFYQPDQGTIFFDNTDISSIHGDILRKNITAVFQDFALYYVSAMDNIALGDITSIPDLDKVKNAARKAGFDKELESLPQSYQTMLGNYFEKGEDLSIGQWQKLAIAKAFYRDSPVILLDEPSSALDAETENEILKNLKSLSENKTVIIISHRFSSISWADIIMVLDDGQVVESGTHKELMANNGRYFRMYNLSKGNNAAD